jgi:hypothetical protein
MTARFSFAVTVIDVPAGDGSSIPALEFYFRELPSITLRPTSSIEVEILGSDFVRQLLEHVAKAAMR